MKFINVTSSKPLLDKARALGILEHEHRVIQATVYVHQFLSGSQGRIECTHCYQGPVLDVSGMPTLKGAACCSDYLDKVTFTCMLVAGRLVQVATGVDPWRINLPAMLDPFAQDEIRNRISELEAEVEHLRSKLEHPIVD